MNTEDMIEYFDRAGLSLKKMKAITQHTADKLDKTPEELGKETFEQIMSDMRTEISDELEKYLGEEGQVEDLLFLLLMAHVE